MIQPLWRLLCRLLRGRPAFGAARSGRWPSVRARHLKAHHACAACGSRRRPEVHHIRPFHLHPELELDPGNLITLCEDCHLTFGHLRSWSSYNPLVCEDAAWYLTRVRSRPGANEEAGR